MIAHEAADGATWAVWLEPDEDDVARRLLAGSDHHEDWMVTKDRDLRLNGWRAQVAVAALFGIDPGSMRAGPDRGIDLRVGGRTVQVKYARHRDGAFYLPYYQPRLHADIGILVRPGPAASPGGFTVGGFTTLEQFEQTAHRLWWQRKPTDGGPGLLPGELWPMSLLPIPRRVG